MRYTWIIQLSAPGRLTKISVYDTFSGKFWPTSLWKNKFELVFSTNFKNFVKKVRFIAKFYFFALRRKSSFPRTEAKSTKQGRKWRFLVRKTGWKDVLLKHEL